MTTLGVIVAVTGHTGDDDDEHHISNNRYLNDRIFTCTHTHFSSYSLITSSNDIYY